MAKKNGSQQPPNADPGSNPPPPPGPDQKLVIIVSPNQTFTGRRNILHPKTSKPVTVIFHEGKSQPVGEDFGKMFCGKYKLYGLEPAAKDAIP